MQDNPNTANKADDITKTFSQAVNVLFLGNPQKTALGVLLGIVLQGVTEIFFQLKKLTIAVNPLFYMSLGIIILNVKNLFSNAPFDPDLEKYMRYIELEHKRGHFTKEEQEAHWKKFDEMVVKKIAESTGQSNSGQPEKENNRTATQ